MDSVIGILAVLGIAFVAYQVILEKGRYDGAKTQRDMESRERYEAGRQAVEDAHGRALEQAGQAGVPFEYWFLPEARETGGGQAKNAARLEDQQREMQKELTETGRTSLLGRHAPDNTTIETVPKGTYRIFCVDGEAAYGPGRRFVYVQGQAFLHWGDVNVDILAKDAWERLGTCRGAVFSDPRPSESGTDAPGRKRASLLSASEIENLPA